MKSEDIAKLAGVSRSTVSRVINNYGNVPEETRKRVMKVIEEYHYHPNSSARVLAGKKTDTVGLFIVSIAEKDSTTRVYQNSYFSPFIDAVIDTANANGIYVLVHSIYTQQDYNKIKQAFFERRIDAGILVGTEKDLDAVVDVAAQGYPLAIIDYAPEEIMQLIKRGRIAVINSLDHEGTRDILNYLISLGHRDIGILLGRTNTYSGKVRYEAYHEVLREHNIAILPEWELKGDFIKKIATREVQRLVDTGNLPTALFCCNDDMALAAMDVLDQNHIQIPNDISIAGFDGSMLGSYVKPSLTTVQVPIYDMAKKAVEVVLDMMGDSTKTISTYTLQTQLIIRESCAKCSR